MHVPKKSLAFGAAGLIALTLGACADEEPKSSGDGAAPAAEVATAADLTALAGQMQTAQEEAGTSHLEMTYGGEVADAAGLSESTTTADIAYGETVEDTSMRMSMSAMGMDMDMLLVDATMYVGMGEASDGKYIAMTFDELAQDPSMAGVADSMESMDAAAQAELLSDAVTSFEHTGTEKVGDVEADVYTMGVDPTKAEGMAGVDEAMVDQMGEMTVVYKVSPEGLPLAADVTMDLGGQELTMASTFSAWGEPVEVKAPTDSEVVPYSEVAPQQG